METFIAFFDVLGFKEFINNNELEEVKRLFEHLLRESQTAVSGEKNIELSSGIIVPVNVVDFFDSLQI